jgi:hypothetical protein
MDGNIAIIECKQKRWAHQEGLKAPKQVRQTKSRLRGGRAASAPTLEQATLKTASQMVVSPRGHRHHGQPLLKKQANSGHSQQGHKTTGEVLNFQPQAKWRSRHEGANIASPTVFADKGARHQGQANPVHSKSGGLGQQGPETLRPSYKRLTTSPSGHDQQGRNTSRAG